MTEAFDAIVVGARCAGSPTAMLLARKGYRVLVVDRATFPERHGVHPHPAPARRRCPVEVGPARSPGGEPDARRSTPTPSTSVLSRLPARPARETHRSRTVHAGRYSTSCSSTPRLSPARRSAKDFAVDEVLVEDGRVVGIRGHPSGQFRPVPGRSKASGDGYLHSPRMRVYLAACSNVN